MKILFIASLFSAFLVTSAALATDEKLTFGFENNRILALIGNKQVGYVEFNLLPNTNPKIVHATRLFVEPEFRDLGIGTELFYTFLEEFEHEPKTQIILQAYPFGENPSLNEQALMKFYKGFGFELWNNSPYPYVNMRKKNPDITISTTELLCNRTEITVSVNTRSAGSIFIQKPGNNCMVNLYRHYFLNQPISGHIGHIIIDPKFKNKGIGGALLPEALNHLEKKGCTEITAQTSPLPNTIALSPRFFKHFGFEPKSGDKHPIMKKTLKPCIGKKVKNVLITKPYFSCAMGALITGVIKYRHHTNQGICSKIKSSQTWY